MNKTMSDDRSFASSSNLFRLERQRGWLVHRAKLFLYIWKNYYTMQSNTFNVQTIRSGQQKIINKRIHMLNGYWMRLKTRKGQFLPFSFRNSLKRLLRSSYSFVWPFTMVASHSGSLTSCSSVHHRRRRQCSHRQDGTDWGNNVTKGVEWRILSARKIECTVYTWRPRLWLLVVQNYR